MIWKKGSTVTYVSSINVYGQEGFEDVSCPGSHSSSKSDGNNRRKTVLVWALIKENAVHKKLLSLSKDF